MTRDVAKVAHQMDLERVFNKNQLMPRLRREFEDAGDGAFIRKMIEVGIPQDFGLDLLCQMSLHKRCDAKTMFGLMRRHFSSAQETADMVYLAAANDFVDWDDTWAVFIVKYLLSDDIQAELDRYQFPLPMVVEPKDLVDNTTYGYLITNGSVILKNNHHNDDVCLDHLNRMNKVKLTIDNNTATMISNRWRNLDRPKEGESQTDFMKRKRAFEKYDSVAKDVIQVLTKHDNEFFMTHRYDKRGRTYCQGYHVTYQGNAWNKAVIQLAEQELVEC